MNVKLEQLLIGDYVLSDKVIIERKSGTDFTQSLYDNRLFEQASRLVEEFDQVIYILEDFNFSPELSKNVFGALSYLVIRKNIQVIPSQDHATSAAIIERLASWVQEEHADPALARVGPKRITTQQKQIYLLQGLEGVGNKTANLLLENMKSPYTVFSEIMNSEVTLTKTGNPKGITGRLSKIQGIGPAFVAKNKHILMGEREE